MKFQTTLLLMMLVSTPAIAQTGEPKASKFIPQYSYDLRAIGEELKEIEENSFTPSVHNKYDAKVLQQKLDRAAFNDNLKVVSFTVFSRKTNGNGHWNVHTHAFLRMKETVAYKEWLRQRRSIVYGYEYGEDSFPYRTKIWKEDFLTKPNGYKLWEQAEVTGWKKYMHEHMFAHLLRRNIPVQTQEAHHFVVWLQSPQATELIAEMKIEPREKYAAIIKQGNQWWANHDTEFRKFAAR